MPESPPLVPITPVPRPNLFGLSRAELRALAVELGEREYRGEQMYAWLYRRRVRSIEAMTDLGARLRERLSARFDLQWPRVDEKASSRDGTVKFLFAVQGATIEAVDIPEERRRTICISTQAGCPVKCAFCLTGISGYKRNLHTSEILGQVATIMAEAPSEERPWNIVVMGMGEPLLNYENTVAALRILLDPVGFGIAQRRLTLSTVGILPALEKLMLEPLRPNLAISLHAPNTALRRALMPIEAKYPIEDVIAAAQRYPVPRAGAVTYEYVLLGGVNDSAGNARELARLLRGLRCKVNLIPLNAAPDIPFRAPSEKDVDAFARILVEAEIPVSVRRSRGQDISAACGQLHFKREMAGAAAPAAR